MTPDTLKTMKGDILSLLEENPTYTKGDLIHHFSLPITSSQGNLSHLLSYLIWGYNQKTGRKGGYSLSPTIF